MSLLEVEGLSKSYRNTVDQSEHIILKNLSLRVPEGQFLCVLGRSGCGKSTFLRCVGGFEKYQGTIRVDGQKVTEPGTDRVMVFQDFNQLFPWKTVEKNIQYPFKLKGIRDKKKLQEISDQALEKVNLFGYQKYYPHQLSGGMKQRVSIAKALALKPRIILMDEPFAALDAMTRSELQKEVLRLSKEAGCTVIFVTHNIEEAIFLGDRIVVFGKEGELLADEQNTVERPRMPGADSYTRLWGILHDAVYHIWDDTIYYI